MKKCNHCHTREGTKRWGKWRLCDVCHKMFYAELKSEGDYAEVSIPETSSLGSSGGYSHGKNKIEIYGLGHAVEVTISHEVVHHVLNVLIDPPTSYDFDNISKYGEIHTELFAVCDER